MLKNLFVQRYKKLRALAILLEDALIFAKKANRHKNLNLVIIGILCVRKTKIMTNLGQSLRNQTPLSFKIYTF